MKDENNFDEIVVRLISGVGLIISAAGLVLFVMFVACCIFYALDKILL